MKMLGISIIKRGLYILTKWQFVKSFWKKEESLFFIYLLSEKRSFLTESFFDLDWPLVSNSIAVKDVHTPDHITKTRFSRCSYSSSSFPSSSKKIYSYIYTTSNILMRPRSSVNWLKILSFFFAFRHGKNKCKPQFPMRVERLLPLLKNRSYCCCCCC